VVDYAIEHRVRIDAKAGAALVTDRPRNAHGDILGFVPPLVTTREEVDEIISIAETAVREVMDELSREEAFAWCSACHPSWESQLSSSRGRTGSRPQ
jgi:hypothetical protein